MQRVNIYITIIYRCATDNTSLMIALRFLMSLIFVFYSVLSSLLLSAVSGEDTQARTDRIMLIPWVKFLWESYRQCLDLLRNNNRVEKLYQDIAQDGEL